MIYQTTKQNHQRLLLLIIGLLPCIKALSIPFSQTSKIEEPQQKPFLALKYYDFPENKYENIFLSAFLEKFPTNNREELEIVIKEGHKYFIEHQEDILTEIKVNELIESREIGKKDRKKRKAEFRAEMWAPLLSALPDIISNATMAAQNAAQMQEQQYQQKINRDNEIQAFLARNSSKTSYAVPQQNFGNFQNTKAKSSNRKATTSNGYEEPLSSASVSTKPDYVGSINAGERVVQGVFVYNSQQTVVKLRFFNGQITAYSTSRDALNREQWISIYPDTPHPTMDIQDGNLARDYKYKVSGNGRVFYFNL